MARNIVRAIPYLSYGQLHDYVPDFVVCLKWKKRDS